MLPPTTIQHLGKNCGFRNRRDFKHHRQNKRFIEDHFDKSYELEQTLQRAGKDRDLKKIRKITSLADICYVRQKELKGLGDAIRCSRNHIDDEPFAVLLGHSLTKSQIPCTKQLMNTYDKYQKSTIALTKVEKNKKNNFRIITGSEVEANVYKITGITERFEKENPTNLAVIGRCILTP